ncbi:hypothetical protein F909_03971 [Acinetobacter sp. ANC 3929]|nr:hypothetical protein F909_03971 [Acinetobacter sp. ANC 3929]
MFTILLLVYLKKEQFADDKLPLLLSFVAFKFKTLSNYEPCFEQDDLL